MIIGFEFKLTAASSADSSSWSARDWSTFIAKILFYHRFPDCSWVSCQPLLRSFYSYWGPQTPLETSDRNYQPARASFLFMVSLYASGSYHYCRHLSQPLARRSCAVCPASLGRVLMTHCHSRSLEWTQSSTDTPTMTCPYREFRDLARSGAPHSSTHDSQW